MTDEQLKHKHKGLRAEIRKKMIENAKQATQYIAYGEVLKRDLAEKHGLPVNEVEYMLAVVCDELCRKLT